MDLIDFLYYEKVLSSLAQFPTPYTSICPGKGHTLKVLILFSENLSN